MSGSTPFDGGPAHERRAPRPLGRGLEEVSHFFLPGSAPATPGVKAGEAASERAARQVARAGLAVLHPGPALTRIQVVDTLRECRNALGDDILAIGAGIACSPYGDIDLIALDRAHQLTIVDVQIRLDDGMVARGLSHVDWAVRNLPIVQRLYPNWPIDMTRPPRLVLVAPRFSLMLRSGIRQVASPAISCFRYASVDLSGETGLLVERV
jgi:hypothetical protein